MVTTMDAVVGIGKLCLRETRGMGQSLTHPLRQTGDRI